MTTIAQRSQVILTQIADAARNANRQPNSVSLVAVSKMHPSSMVREAYLAGLRDFGENYLQEALEKQMALADLPLIWHFIGPIQSNKTKPIAESFSWVHGVDRLKIAQRLSEARPESLPPLNICLQVNVSGESSKSGCAPEEVASLAKAVVVLPKLKLRGLMAIPEPTTDVTLQHQQFRMLHDLMSALNADGLALDTLSMGMSHDFAVAIAEGATMVRVGTAIFGERNYSEN
ncbi:MAG: YggS family pyridoxal phosphate-dependent enzyme [Methylophilales bacterium]|nr:YggS family pyridoxal phosphate-dependent enzyme [Methylophilales bacterium]